VKIKAGAKINACKSAAVNGVMASAGLQLVKNFASTKTRKMKTKMKTKTKTKTKRKTGLT